MDEDFQLAQHSIEIHLTWAFLLFIGIVLAVLADASWRLRRWAWHLTLAVYGIGVIGSLWQVSVGITEGWLAAIVNGAVVAYAAQPAVRRGGWRRMSTPAAQGLASTGSDYSSERR